MDPAAVTKGNNRATDVYSFCVLALEVLSGRFVDKITSLDGLMKRAKPTSSSEFPETVPKKLRTLLCSGFDEDQDRRTSWTQLIVAFRKLHIIYLQI